jgi:hypothetical protein
MQQGTAPVFFLRQLVLANGAHRAGRENGFAQRQIGSFSRQFKLTALREPRTRSFQGPFFKFLIYGLNFEEGLVFSHDFAAGLGHRGDPSLPPAKRKHSRARVSFFVSHPKNTGCSEFPTVQIQKTPAHSPATNG